MIIIRVKSKETNAIGITYNKKMYENEQERTKNTVFAVMKCSELKNEIGDII
jgi:hypothetical protein